MNLKPDSRIDDVWIPATGLKAPLIKPATWVAHGISGAWQFANGDDETLIVDMQIPIHMDRDINPIIIIGWSADGVNPGNCEWQLAYKWLEVDSDTTGPALATITQIAPASAIRANGMVLTAFSDEILHPSKDDVCIQLNIKRLAAGILDTIADTVEMLGVCMSFNKKEGM